MLKRPYEIINQSLAEQCYTALRQKIVSGALCAGQRLYEGRLADELGVSKTPIRSALLRLSQEAMVEFRERRGFFVCSISSQDIRDVVELREVVEALAVRKLADYPNPATIKALRACFADIKPSGVDAINPEFAKADFAFHQLLVESADSALLQRMRNLLDIPIQMYLVCRHELDSDDQDRLHAEHKAIVDAIERSDGEHAEALIREHIRDAWRELGDGGDAIGFGHSASIGDTDAPSPAAFQERSAS